jgi:hypothetical protein
MQNTHYSTRNSIKPKDVKSETIRQLAHRHMLDENHTTTDEELKNARIEFIDDFDTPFEGWSDHSKVDNNTVLPPLPFRQNADNINNNSSDFNTDQKSFPNPYNVLG